MSGQVARILIAEDEVLIATLVASCLEDEGLATKIVHGGRDALDALQATPTGFEVLVTDIRVGSPPDGWGIAHSARAANPDIGVIYITGDGMDDWRARGVPDSILIAKPFVPAQIVTAVMSLVNGAASHSSV